ncbi:two-component sensor histidine kinase [Aeromicrobium sp. A1-2]|uniref:sensor histidine kinase n=1 Tax=Aeromicrobium sp. A1-2 TaxID=2107713 RepID=UPI000E4D58F1|nr:ATP-binding protein [Aeromicrobium sp. A1-2]AXT85045.1 two-component sensor histidine kinase [Aeromicrobium sp. A1-2]
MTLRERLGSGFGVRLLGAQALVLLAGAATTWIVATIVGPGIFRDHLHRAGVPHTAAEEQHVERAFTSSLAIAISIALVAATVTALAVTWYFSRRVQRSIAQVSTATAHVAAGQYDVRVNDPGLGREFSVLASTSNTLAERLETAETTRRRMLADLAHEMRTPLATVDAHLEAIEDGIRDLDADTLGVIRLSTQRLKRLAEDISAVSRAEEGILDITRTPIAAAGLVSAAARTADGRIAAAGINLQIDLMTDAQVLVDPDRIGQVLTNLLDNALRHTPPGGTVRISCSLRGRWVQYVVADTGDGIAPEHLSHVFERFYRADAARARAHGGSGIGLSIAKALVEAHGGEITASSPGPGRGAEFSVRLRVI